MYIISGSAMRSGSSWYLNITNDLLLSTKLHDVRKLRHSAQIDDIIQNEFCRYCEAQIYEIIAFIVN